jgi:arylsulfatase A-like enzyme
MLISACVGGTSDNSKIDKPNIIVIFTDDQGFADLGVQNQLNDIKTPYIDQMASKGAQFTHAYVTAPQCTPSRAGIISGQYQQRFGLDDNRYTPMPLDVRTLGQRFQELGYTTGMAGKWHLEIDQNSREFVRDNYPELDERNFTMDQIPIEEKHLYYPDRRGYEDTYFGYHRRYWATFDTSGNTRAASYIADSTYRIDAVSNAATAFIARNWKKPFYLHVAHYAPHVPLEATERYLDRFPNDIEVRRKYALAMMSAVDDGVGRILSELTKYQIEENTLVFFVSDNGAPLGLDMTNAPISERHEAWNGSMNTPLVGEKGMLTDGGVRVPYLLQWPGTIPSGTSIDKPVSTLDIGYTALKLAGATDLSGLDGIDLMPALTSDDNYLNSRSLYWRFWQQAAIRKGKWKYLRAGLIREYLFDMESVLNEKENLITFYPDIAQTLKADLDGWENDMLREVLPVELGGQEKIWFDYFL